MPSWEDWISMTVPPGHKHHLLILLSLFFNISPYCGLPSRSKEEIAEEVMQPRVSWFDNIHPGHLCRFHQDPWMVLSQSGQDHVTCCCIHVWVLTTLYFLYFFCNYRSAIFSMYQKVSTLWTMHLRIFHVSGVSTPVPAQLAGDPENLRLHFGDSYDAAIIGTGVRFSKSFIG